MSQYVGYKKQINDLFANSAYSDSEFRTVLEGKNGYRLWSKRLDYLSDKIKNVDVNTANQIRSLIEGNKYLSKRYGEGSEIREKINGFGKTIDNYVNNYFQEESLLREPVVVSSNVLDKIRNISRNIGDYVKRKGEVYVGELRNGFLRPFYQSKLFKPVTAVCITGAIFAAIAAGCYRNNSLEEKVNKKKSGYEEVLPRNNKAFYAAFDGKGYDKKADDLLALTERNIGEMSDDELLDDHSDINPFLNEVSISELTRLAKRSQTDIDDNKVEHFKKKLDKLGNYIGEIKREIEARTVSSVALKKARVGFELEKMSGGDINSLKDYFSNFKQEYADLENKVNSTKTNEDNKILSQLVEDIDNLNKERLVPVLSDFYSLSVFNSLVARDTNEAAKNLEYLIEVDNIKDAVGVVPVGLKKDWKIFNRKIRAHCNEQDPYWDWDNLNEINKFLKKAKEVSPHNYRELRSLALMHVVEQLKGVKPKSFLRGLGHELMLWQNLWEGPEGIYHMFVPAKYKDNSNEIVNGNGRLTSGDLSNWLQDGLFATKEFAELYAVYCGIASLTNGGGGNGGGVVTPPSGGGGEGPGGPGGS